MTTTAKSIIQRVVTALTDVASVQWTIGELARYFNDGQREVAILRPDATSKVATLPLVSGARQALPAGSAKLLDVMRNTGGDMQSVRLVDKGFMDSQASGWQSMTPSATVIHYMYDGRDPLAFYVYPPATITASLEIMYSAIPTPITEPASGTFDSIAGNMDLPDLMAGPLADYILSRTYRKNSEAANNVAKADSHYALFVGSIGAEVAATSQATPAARTS